MTGASERDLRFTDYLDADTDPAADGNGANSRKKPRKADDAISTGMFMESAASRAGEYQPPSACRRASYPSLAPAGTDGFMSESPRQQGMPMSGPTDKTSVTGSSDKQEEEPTADDFARMSRSERKRYREKKRRNEVNKGFDDLMAMLLKVDPAVQDALEDCEKSTRKQAGENLAAEGDKPILNRVDLIGRTIATLERMSRENNERKELLAQIARGGNDVDAARQAIKDDRVLLMIPFLSPTGPVMVRQSADSTTCPSQQQRQAAAMTSGARYQNNMPSSPMAYQAPQQPADSVPSRYGDLQRC